MHLTGHDPQQAVPQLLFAREKDTCKVSGRWFFISFIVALEINIFKYLAVQQYAKF